MFRKIFRRLLFFIIEHSFSVVKGRCFFIPHAGIYKSDHASLLNYKSDNCLVFIRYILDNDKYKDKEIILASSSSERIREEQEFCELYYPNANIRIIPYYDNKSDVSKIKQMCLIATSEYVFASEPHMLFPKHKNQLFVCLSYYPITLKNDYFLPSDKYYMSLIQDTKRIDYFSSCSQINSITDSAYASIPYHKFVTIGKCRTDVLLKKEDTSFVRCFFQNMVSYKIEKLILYVPTHRDYEQNVFDMSRSILGFDVNFDKFAAFLENRGIVIVAKLHPKQNAAVISNNLPKGVIRFDGNKCFGLVELMQESDAMITDYTSAYVDYLLLNKPVLFNFYDLDTYKQERGLAFDPYSTICEGIVFVDEESFYRSIDKAFTLFSITGRREEIIDYLVTHRDNVCNRTYSFVFEDKRISLS